MELNNILPDLGSDLSRRKSEPKFFRLADKAKLLCSKQNPIFERAKRLLGVENATSPKGHRNDLLRRIYGIDASTIRHWQNTYIKRPSSAQLQKSFETICKSIERWGVQLKTSDFEDACDEVDFGEKFDLSWRMVQLILDDVLYVSPTQARGFLSSKDDAARIFQLLEGVWYLYHRCPTKDSHLLTRSALRIRHVVPARHRLSYIACKLHITSVNEPPVKSVKPYISYKGLVTSRADCFYFDFDKRFFPGQGESDMLSIRVKSLRSQANPVDMLTGEISATTEQGVLYSATTFLQRVAIENPEDRDEFVLRMRHDLKVYTPAEESQLLSAFPMIGCVMRPPYLPVA